MKGIQGIKMQGIFTKQEIPVKWREKKERKKRNKERWSLNL